MGSVNMYRIALCENNDDDKKWIKTLLDRISTEQNIPYLLSEYSSAEIFLNHMQPFLYDIAIFDVEMNKISGIEAAKRLRDMDKNVKIIFTTVHADNVFSSFYAEPLHFFIKPVKYEAFQEVFMKAIESIKRTQNNVFAFSFNNVIYSVPVSEIIYFESNKRVITIITARERFNVYGKLNNFENQKQLSYFIRCSHSYLVNPEYIKTISNNSVVLANGESLPISRGKVKIIKEQFMQYISELLP